MTCKVDELVASCSVRWYLIDQVLVYHCACSYICLVELVVDESQVGL